MIPISETNSNISRGPKNSKEFIKMCDDIHYDIEQIYDLVNKHDMDIVYNMDALMVENYFLQNRIEELNNEIINCKNDIKNFDSSYVTRTMYNTFRTQSDIIKPQHPVSAASIDSLHGIVTLSANIINKTNIVNQFGEAYIPKDLSIKLYESPDGFEYTEVTDANIMRTFDNKNESVWIRQASFPASEEIEELYVKLVITVPIKTINNYYINTISIKPYPEYAMDICNIEYKSVNSNNNVQLPTFPAHNIKQAKKNLFIFEPIEMQEITIILRQPYYFKDEIWKKFYYGMQEIGIYYYDFTATDGYIITRHELDDKFFKIINVPKVTIATGCQSSAAALVSHELFFPGEEIAPNNSSARFGEEISGNYSEVYILTRLRKVNNIVPVISGIEIQYLTI